MRVQRPLLAASVVFILLNATITLGGDQQENPDLRGTFEPIRGPRAEKQPGRPSAATVEPPTQLGPAPRLAAITRFVPPIEPWVQSGLGWGDPALGDDGEPLCETNRVPGSQCDPLGPRPFLHAGFDAQPAPDRSVRASAAGWVVAAHRSSAAFTGRRSAEGGGVVVLRHDMDGDPATGDDVLLTVYEHIEPVVSAGDVVGQGEVIARTSALGGEHLHFGVRRAEFDPADPNVYHGILPPEGTTGCLPCFSRPFPLPAFPEHWEDPARLFRSFEWARLFAAVGEGAAGDILETPDGYVAAGWTQAANIGGTGSPDMWILRLDAEGRILSQRAYGGPGGEQVRRLVATADGGFAALALSESLGTGVASLLLKFDAVGERPQWQSIYIASGLVQADLKQTSDGGYVMAGATDPCTYYGGCARASVVKVDSGGAVQWARSYRSLAASLPDTIATSIVQTVDGGYTVAGLVRESPFSLRTDLLVFRLDASGNLLWAKSYVDDVPGQIVATGDGGFIIVGRNLFRGPFVQKILEDGTVDWEATYGNFEAEAGNRIVQTSDGGYVVAGDAPQLDSLGEPVTPFERDLWILKLDSAGQILLQRSFDGRGRDDTTVGLRATRDGGFVLAGAGDGGCRLGLACGGLPSFLVVKTNADLEVSAGCGTNTNRFSRRPRPSFVQPHPLHQQVLIVTASPTDVAIVSTDASNHVCEDGYYGPPPTFQSVSVEFFEKHAVCDLTGTLEAQLCTRGIPGVTATSPVIIDAAYDALALTAHVTDPDSTTDRNDVVEVLGGLRLEDSNIEVPVVLVDDGSSTVVQLGQRAGPPQDCFYDRMSGICACKDATYATYSGDALLGDARYTRESAVINQGLPGLGFDCALATESRMPLLFPGEASFDIFLRATDRQGNTSAWPEPFQARTGVPALSCSGDACGCCLLRSPVPNRGPEEGGCFGVEGMSGIFHICRGFTCLGECRAVGGPDSTYQSGICKEIRNYDCCCFDPCGPGHCSGYLDCPFVCF